MRVNIIGTSGSGKSTLARRLSGKLASPYIEMDALFLNECIALAKGLAGAGGYRFFSTA